MCKKITKLEGYYATGDYECFCFDKHSGPESHDNHADQSWLAIEDLADRIVNYTDQFSQKIEVKKLNDLVANLPDEHEYYEAHPEAKKYFDNIKSIQKSKGTLTYDDVVSISEDFVYKYNYCRVYPNALLPELPAHIKGNWKIEITFEPDPEELLKLLIK